MYLSKKEKCYALMGLMLGDGSYKHGWIRIGHTNAQRFYVQFLQSFCAKHNLRHSLSWDKKQNTTFGEFTYSYINIKIPSNRHFEKFNRVNDASGKKQASEYVLRRITPLGLLFWYLDDGSFNYHLSADGRTSRSAYLNTHGFSEENQQQIRKMLKQRFDIDTGLHTDTSPLKPGKKYKRIYINATNFRKFYDLVRQYLNLIPKEFGYKFNMKYVPNKLKNSIEFSQKYNFNQLGPSGPKPQTTTGNKVVDDMVSSVENSTAV